MFYKDGTGMQREALTLAIEALSWMELRRINGRLALRRTARQLGIRDESALQHAFRLIMEATRRRNAVDNLMVQALGQEEFEDLSLGVRSFLRIYTYEVKYGEKSLQEVLDIASLAREILGPKELAPVEEALDLIPHLEIWLEGLPHDEAMALRTFHPAWYVRYCAELLGRGDALRLLQAPGPRDLRCIRHHSQGRGQDDAEGQGRHPIQDQTHRKRPLGPHPDMRLARRR
jgi:hypothetical protein